MRYLLMGLMAVALAGCTAPPQAHKVETSAIVPHSSTDTWQALTRFATNHGLAVGISNEQGGVLQAALTSDQLARYADCGSTHSVTLPDPQGSITVQISPTDSGTSVTARLVATDRMFLASAGEISRAPCNSRGILEAEIYQALR
mgnify:CR=1 FL=1